METITIVLKDVLKKELAILYNDGLKLYEQLKKNEGKVITISFEGIKQCTTTFLNASIGKYIIDPNSDSSGKLKFIGVESDSVLDNKIKLVIKNASNPQQLKFFNENLRAVIHA